MRSGGGGLLGALIGILLLLTLLFAFLWTAFSMGLFKGTVQLPQHHQIGRSDKRGGGGHVKAGGPAPHRVEYVIPIKSSPPPIKGHDLLYMPNPDEEPVMRHHSGHFRQKMAAVWDPHPEYEFTAFGVKFHLDLAHGHKFTAPNLKVTRVWEDSIIAEHPGLRPEGCFYSGTVRGDPKSSVVVNLCHGMRGHIRTSNGSYFIEPSEQWKDENTPMKHAVTTVTTPSTSSPCHSNLSSYEDGRGRTMNDDVVERRRRRSGRVKRSTSQEYFIELMVVVDKKMAEFHGEELNTYVLTLMSIVAMIFKDASIGNPISVAVVKMEVLEEMDLVRRGGGARRGGGGISASEMLVSFCDWQHKKSDNNDASPNHHDSALLLTRDKICRDPSYDECETLGLAELGTMCDKFSSCSLVKDIGLNSAFTIAHELGHVLNMPHDDDVRCKEYRGSDDVHLVMSRMLDHNTYPWSWSNCSRHFLTEYLDAGYGYCLQDRPSMDILNEREDKEKLPGEGFTEDRQCELIYDKGSKLCPYMPKCEKLWCTNSPGEPDGCRSRQLPSADGTPCYMEGNRSTYWCQKGHCVPKDRGVLRPVDGGWGSWQNYGECSRTCGGGVKKAVRHCNFPPPTNGGRYCVGKRVKYKSCSTRECPSGAIDFREQQCAKFNNNNFDIHGLSENVTWVPKYGNIGSEDRCKLYCRVAHSTAYYQLKDKVIDGTLCDPDTFHICVNGICHSAGCDHVFNSTMELDFCGVCGGNNSTCQQVTGQYDEARSGYSRVVVIPAGSTNLDIRQHGFRGSNKDHNYLALVDSETQNYILNGKYVVSTYHKLIFYSGTPLEYTGSNAVVERINSSRPLTKDLIVEVLSVGDLYPPNIVYQYTVRNSSFFRYEWFLMDNWSSCDKKCQGESHILGEYRCIKADDNEEVSPEMCTSLEKPSKPPSRSCNTYCSIRWEIVSQSECLSECGSSSRNVVVKCVEEYVNNSRRIQVPDSMCNHLPKPNETEPCQGPCKHVKWNFTDWEPCSETCGSGIQVRRALCVDGLNRRRNDSECRKTDLIVKRVCNQQSCPQWMTGEWAPCSVSCGSGLQHRPYWCQHDNVKGSPNDCPEYDKPRHTKACNRGPCPHWIPHDWSQCSASCGNGQATRHVVCSMPGACSPKDKPSMIKSCVMQPCSYENAIPDSTYFWKPGPWSMCSVKCGIGERKRVLTCYDKISGQVADDSRSCSNSVQLPISEICSGPSCPKWFEGEWSSCHGTRGIGYEYRQVRCIGYDGLEADEWACPLPKPDHARVCNSVDMNHIGKWSTGKWSECSVSCGGGVKRRQVTCDGGHCGGSEPLRSVRCNLEPCKETMWKMTSWSECNSKCGRGLKYRKVWCENSFGVELSDNMCGREEKPESVQECHNQHCNKAYHWQHSRWSSCSRSCGKGVRHRNVHCVSEFGHTVNPSFCRRQRKPKEVSECRLATCPFEWVEGEWSQCSVSCGRGKQTRSVWCTSIRGYGGHSSNPELFDESYCDPRTRPEEVKLCTHQPCHAADYRWKTGEWLQCSHPCTKKGRQTRKLFCYKGNKKVKKMLCPKETRPRKKQKCPFDECNVSTCSSLRHNLRVYKDGEYMMRIGPRMVFIYCSQMQTLHPKEFITLHAGEGENYAEIYDKRAIDPSTCPNGGERNDYCYCEKNTNSNVGFTGFSKIRINTTSLLVDTKDFTFSKQVRGWRVPYGEAGDCYSRDYCPQGQFRINLAQTGFTISRSTMWYHHGDFALAQVNISEDHLKVTGKCGGYCGMCGPKHGLKLDVVPL